MHAVGIARLDGGAGNGNGAEANILLRTMSLASETSVCTTKPMKQSHPRETQADWPRSDKRSGCEMPGHVTDGHDDDGIKREEFRSRLSAKGLDRLLMERSRADATSAAWL